MDILVSDWNKEKIKYKSPSYMGASSAKEKNGILRGMVSLEGVNLVLFYYLNAYVNLYSVKSSIELMFFVFVKYTESK